MFPRAMITPNRLIVCALALMVSGGGLVRAGELGPEPAAGRVLVLANERTLEGDIERAGNAVKDARKGRIHVFCATSEIHRKFKLKRAQDEIIKMSVDGVRQALQYVSDVEFSPEDASRTEPEFLAQVVEEVIKAGARTVNIPDTVGYATPGHFAFLIRYLFEHVPNIKDAVVSVHCHNDLGLAVANSLAAVRHGVAECEAGTLRPDLGDSPDDLVAEDPRCVHVRLPVLDNSNVGTADRARMDTQEEPVARALRIGHGLHYDSARPLVDGG